MCGLYQVLEGDVLEPARRPGLAYCRGCQRILDVEQRRGWPPEPPLSEVEKDFILERWPTQTCTEIMVLLGRTVKEKIKEFGARYGAAKQIPNAGRFRKGNVPHTARPDQVEFLRKDKRGVPYWHVRGGKFGFQPKHVALWEAAHGKPPPDMVVAFADGNTLHCVLDNLILLTKAENLARNAGRDELTDAYVARTLAQTGRGNTDTTLKAAVLQAPELLQVKRTQLLLKRAIKESNG